MVRNVFLNLLVGGSPFGVVQNSSRVLNQFVQRRVRHANTLALRPGGQEPRNNGVRVGAPTQRDRHQAEVALEPKANQGRGLHGLDVDLDAGRSPLLLQHLGTLNIQGIGGHHDVVAQVNAVGVAGLCQQLFGGRHIGFVIGHRPDPIVATNLALRHHGPDLARAAQHGLQAGLAISRQAERTSHPDIIERLGFHAHPNREGTRGLAGRRHQIGRRFDNLGRHLGVLEPGHVDRLGSQGRRYGRLVFEKLEHHRAQVGLFVFVVVAVGFQGELLIGLIGLEHKGPGAHRLGFEISHTSGHDHTIGVGCQVA